MVEPGVLSVRSVRRRGEARLPAGIRRAGRGLFWKAARLGGSLAPRPLEWLYLAGGLFLVWRYLWMFDDAFIYYRYIDNLLFLHLGLVFNQGEYVEGYSSPFWVLFLIPLRAAGIDFWTLTRILAPVTFAVFGFLMIRLNRRLCPEGPVVNVPLAFLSFCYGPLCYFSSGSESPFVQIAGVVYAFYFLNPASGGAQAALAISPLVRPELALPFALALVWGWRRLGRIPWRMVALAALFGGGWILFRIYYYADLLPNTFYLKNDTNIPRGLLYVHQTLSSYHLYEVFFLLVGLGLVVHRWRSGSYDPRWRARFAMASAALILGAWVVKIGGDQIHYRFLSFSVILLLCSFAGLAERAIARAPGRPRRILAVAAGLGTAAVALGSYPPQLDRHPLAPEMGHRRTHKIGDAAWHRGHPHLMFRPERRSEDRERRERYRRMREHFHYQGTVAIWMCASAYEYMDRRVVHSFGLTDAILARTDAPAQWSGHKFPLRPRAKELRMLHMRTKNPGPGMYRREVEAGRAPAWIAENIETIDLVARKTYNRHDWRENLALAFSFPPRIRLPAREEAPESPSARSATPPPAGEPTSP